MEIVEIGHSALSILEIHRNRIEDKKFQQKYDRVNRRAIMQVEPNPVGDENSQAHQSEDIASKGFPRGMLRVVVSDGYTEYVAIENKRVPDLSLAETPLGAKVD